jgi:hypothetical protein
MKTALKWILGILIGLILVAAVVAIGFMVAGRSGWGHGMMESRAIHPWDGGRVMPWRDMPMQPYGGMFHRPFGGFFPLATLAGGLFCLGVLVLIVLGIIALVRALSRPKQPAASPAPVIEPAPAPAPALVEVAAHPCPTCGRQVQEDWHHCPHCGADLSAS